LNEILGLVNKIKTVMRTENVEYLSAQAIVERTTRQNATDKVQGVARMKGSF
jgi:hypothetical protein